MRLKPTPDWAKQNVITVDPGIWPEYRRKSCDLRPEFRDLTAALGELGMPHRTLRSEDYPLDLWIRDWGPVEGSYFAYQPSYAAGCYSSGRIAKARHHLNPFLPATPRALPLVLDGGNLVHNGAVAVLTEKVLSDNRQLTRGEVERAILSLGFERIVFVPAEPEDLIGHADGMMRFISPSLLLVNDYSGSPLKAYGRRLWRFLERAGMGAELIPFPWYGTEEKHSGIWSAEGCYINFLQTAGGIVLPSFGNERDAQALEVLQANDDRPVKHSRSTMLARHGGVLNCATLTL